jgi:alpha-glucosidase
MSSVKKYTYGEPFFTEAVVKEIERSAGDPAEFIVDKKARTFIYKLDPSTVCYGLGETVRGMNKRGWLYISNNTDEPHHEEGKNSLYASQNFLLIWSKKELFGIFIDYPGRLSFDIGYTETDTLTITFDDLDADVYIIRGESAEDIVKTFRGLIGKSYIPPKWAFGYGQSRWGYKSADDIREVAREYKKAGIPLDMIYLDIDYMEAYKDFTTNKETFPHFKEFVKEMADEGIHLIPIIDAGVKVEKGYEIYEEGIKGDYFCKDELGKPFTAAVWPGAVHFPDFFKEDTRKWFGDKYSKLVEMGIEGFWNDMNEPAIFYSDKGVKEAKKKLAAIPEKELTFENCGAYRDALSTLDDTYRDYHSFYHDVNGKKVRHDKIHNLYGYNMTRSAGEAFQRNYPDKKILMFSRSSYTGMHRYGGVWTGDNASWWSHLALNIAQMPALNMCGFLYCGADLGGFNDNTTEDLMLRWIAFGMFTPLMRNHSALGTRVQELYRFKNKETFANFIKLRHAFIPYIYDEFIKAAENDTMYFRPLSFVYSDDERTFEIEDQLLVGDSIMIAPVYKQNARGRMVYLPEDMKLLRFRGVEDYDVEEMKAGDHYVRAELNEVLVFVRHGRKFEIDDNSHI